MVWIVLLLLDLIAEMERTVILGIAGLGLLVFSRNFLIVFSDKLSVADAFSLFIQTMCVLLLALFAIFKTLAGNEPPADAADGPGRPAEEVQSKIKAWIQNQQQTRKKHVSLEENLSVRWKMNKNVIAKIEMLSEYIFRDFIRFWYQGGDSCSHMGSTDMLLLMSI